MEQSTREIPQHANRRLAMKLGVAALVMFGFGFALVPLYDVFCNITGLNGKTGNETVRVASRTVPDSRWVTVEFNADVMPGLPWRFEPRLSSMRVHPGQLATAWFRIVNLADRTLAGRAVPSVSPPQAARHFRKIECFCFSQQTLKPGERKDIPVTFIVNRDLPEDVGTLTLSYAFFANKGTILALGDER